MRTTLCYIERDGAYLMLLRNRRKDDVNLNKWIGVGGKFLPEESAEECLLREVYEETGLRLTDYRFRGIVDFAQEGRETESMYLYTADGFTGTPHPCDEGELSWVKKQDIFSLNLWEGDRIFLEKLLRDEPFFLMTLRYRGDQLVGAEDGRMDGAEACGCGAV